MYVLYIHVWEYFVKAGEIASIETIQIFKLYSFQCRQVVVATSQFRCSQLLVISYNVY